MKKLHVKPKGMMHPCITCSVGFDWSLGLEYLFENVLPRMWKWLIHCFLRDDNEGVNNRSATVRSRRCDGHHSCLFLVSVL